MLRRASGSVSFHVWTVPVVCPAKPQTMSGLSGATKGHAQKSLNCLWFADTPRGLSKLGKTQMIRDVRRSTEEIPDFAIRIAAPGCIWNVIVSVSYNKTYPISY